MLIIIHYLQIFNLSQKYCSTLKRLFPEIWIMKVCVSVVIMLMVLVVSGSRSGDGKPIYWILLSFTNIFHQMNGSFGGSLKNSTAASAWRTLSAWIRSRSVTAAPGSWLPAPAASWTWTGSVAPPRPSGSWQPSQSSSSSSSSPAASAAVAAVKQCYSMSDIVFV